MAVTVFNKLKRVWSDITQFFKGMYVSSSLGDVGVAVIPIPRKGFVKNVYLEVETAYTAASTGSVTVGYEAPDKTAVPDYFFANAQAAPLTKGIKASMNGMYFEKGGSISVTFAKGNSAADVNCRVFADIAVIY